MKGRFPPDLLVVALGPVLVVAVAIAFGEEVMENVATHEDWKSCFSEVAPGLLFARQWTRSPADAEDIVQEAFVKFWRRNVYKVAIPVVARLVDRNYHSLKSPVARVSRSCCQVRR